MNLSRLVSTFFIVGLFINLAGCGSSYVAKIGDETITPQEFNREYSKNNSSKDSATFNSLDDRKKFLDLYTKFRLKVKEAKALGYDRDPELQAELAQYKNNLAVSYVLDNQLTDPALKRLYERKQKEIRASHILIRLPQNPSPQDTLAAFTKAEKIIDSLRMGYSFDTLALHNSQDPSVKNNRGDLYYFTAGMMVPEFEDAVYSLRAGEYTQHPVRTQFGYHIITVTGIQPNQNAVHVAHIMKHLTPSSTVDDTMKAIRELTSIRDSVMHGGSFENFARTISDDKYSAARGGDLGFVPRGRTIRPFDSAIFRMKDGEISKIVKTQYGFHLIKRYSAKGIPPFKDMEQQLKTEYQRNRYQYDYHALVDRIKKMFSFTENPSAYRSFAQSVDTSKNTNDPTWDSTITASTRSMVIFTFAGQKITIDSMIALAKINQNLKGMSLKLPATARKIADNVGENVVITYYAQQLERTIPDFAETIGEYENGILLFKAEQENVWNKVVPTDSALNIYYADHHADYTWPDRISIQEIFVPTDSVAKIVQKALTGYTRDSLVIKKTKRKTKKPQYETVTISVPPISFDSAAVVYNTRNSTRSTRGIWELQPVAGHQLLQKCWKRNLSDTLSYFPQDNGFSFVKILSKDPAREKTFEEAKSELSGAYQEYQTQRVENEWYARLKKKYPVTINMDELKKSIPSSEEVEAKRQ